MGLQVQLPQYVDYVKTGAFKELSPLDPDWYYTRAGVCERGRPAMFVQTLRLPAQLCFTSAWQQAAA